MSKNGECSNVDQGALANALALTGVVAICFQDYPRIALIKRERDMI